ncbi:MAG: FtsW/RodA/SpoVE family cell cycle protein [Lachnospiraceae bacterium]|nr:FtsW/RodA/SpoVE family cell cycle protein [Lachnospiraceae bacterium]
MEEYLEKLLSQIRCKKARPYIEEEIRSHLESQTEENITAGMDPEEAEQMAVKDMGNPVEVGISLDRIHKPRIAWKLLVVVGILSVLGILVQASVFRNVGMYDLEPYLNESYRGLMIGFVSSVILGFVIMCGIYFIDYTFIAKYSKIIALLIIIMGILLLTGVFGGYINGTRYGIGFGPFTFSATSMMMFYVPIYGAILYKYRGGGIVSLLKSVGWLILPVIITFRMPNIIVAGMIMISMLIQLTTAIFKGWFQVKAKRTVAVLWSVFMVLPAIALFMMYQFHLLASYQEERIRAFFQASGDGFYLTARLRTLCQNISLVGNSGNDVIGTLPDFNRDYVFSYILNCYGILFGIVVVAILALLVMFIFSTSVKQKNELGMVMGFGCGMVFLLNSVLNVLGAMGLIPPTSSFLPFFSVGRSNIVLCYALIGIVMSIYRYKDVYPKKLKASDVSIQKNFTINI